MNTTNEIEQKVVAASAVRMTRLEFSNLRANDVIVINTCNSLYSFVIDDERTMTGKLTSEACKRHFPAAVLIGALVYIGERLHTFSSRLETRAQALFLVDRGGTIVELITSTIMGLCCFRAREEER